jgi:ABC-type multidrug transport system ATPase subunit
VLLSSRDARDIEHVADVCVVLDGGRVVVDAPVGELLAGAARTASIRLRTPHPGPLAAALAERGHACFHVGTDALRVHDITPNELRRLAATARVEVSQVVDEQPDLESVVAGFIERSRSQ